MRLRARAISIYGWLSALPRALWLLALVLACSLQGVSPAPAQQQDKPKLPVKKDVTYETEDGVILKASYWAGINGKETVPVILLHGSHGNRQDFNALAEFLQEHNCAVLAPDLRGHGDSTQISESPRTLQAAEMSPAAFADMIEDVEASKKFLMAKNNSGELNIDKLCLVGADMGGVVGANWAIDDWNWPPLAVGKQGQDVKAIVLLSPPERFKSLRMLEPLSDRSVRSRIAFYIAVGNQDPTAVREATKLYTHLKKYHPTPVKAEDQDLFFDRRINSRMQGTKLLGKEFKDFGLMENIAEFIEERAGKQPHVWHDRTLP